MHRMLCIQSCGKPAHTGAFAPNHVLMFAQNPAFGYCVPPCVDEEKSLSRVKVFRTPCWLLVRRIFKSASKLFYSRLCILEWEQVLEGVLEQVPERVSGAGSRAFPQRLPERVPRSLRPKPLCQALQDAWSPKTRAYSVLCLMQS